MAESFFATLETEFYYRRVWVTKTRAKLRGRRLDRGPLQPSPPAFLNRPNHPSRLRDAIPKPDCGRTRSRITRVSTIRGQGDRRYLYETSRGSCATSDTD
jgi:hypothetical protein